MHDEYGINVPLDLIKIQAVLGAKMPYKEDQEILEKFSY